MHVHLEWTPQRLVWICLFLSLFGALLCIALAIPRPRLVLAHDDDAPPDAYSWRTFVRFDGRDVPTMRTALGIALGSAALTAAVIGPLAGLVTGVLALGATRRHRARWWLAVGSPALLAVAGAYVVARQARYHPTAAFEWPGELAAVHQIGWLAVAFLLTLVAADWAWERVNRRRRAVAAAAASAPPVDASPTDDAGATPP